MTGCPTDDRTTANLPSRKPFQPADTDDADDEETLEALVDDVDDDELDDDGDASEDDEDESFDFEAEDEPPRVPPRNGGKGSGSKVQGSGSQPPSRAHDPEPQTSDDEEDEGPLSNDLGESPDGERARRTRARTDPRKRARGPGGGMGRPSTGPRRRSVPEPREDAVSGTAADTELVADISTWPGTAEAARMVGRHTSTIKAWRTQGRIRAEQDASQCWRYHPEDLAEAMAEPEGNDPGSVLAAGMAAGMNAIVSQGGTAHERLLTMTEIATDGLKDATKVLSEELKRAYGKIADLEKKLEEANDKLRGDRTAELQHDRYVRRLDHRHELALVGARESSERVSGLLEMIGPIAASIVHRLVGNLAGANAIDAASVGGVVPPSPAAEGAAHGPAPAPDPAAPATAASSTSNSAPSGAVTVSPATSSPSSVLGGDQRLVTIEARIADAMARLCFHIRKLDQPAFAGLRAMLPQNVAEALDAIVRAENDQLVGKALAIVVQAAQGLSDLQFKAIRPIAPADVAYVIAELRDLFRSNDVVITPDSPR